MTDEKEQTLEEIMKEDKKKIRNFAGNVTYPDEKGNELHLIKWGGYHVTPFLVEGYDKIADLPIRDDDVLLCGYPKTGSNWTWEVVSMVLRQSSTLSKLGKGPCFVEFAGAKLLNACPSPRLLNTHVLFKQLPKQVFEKKTKIIYTVRNPKDTAVSYYNHHKSLEMFYKYKGEFHDWFPFFMEGKIDFGDYFSYQKEWADEIYNNPDHPVLIVAFEDMKQDLPRSIRRIAKYLNVQLTDELVLAIAEQAGFSKMKQTYTETNNFALQLLRKGAVGDWKNWLTVSESEQIDAAMLTHLPHTVFSTPKYTL